MNSTENPLPGNAADYYEDISYLMFYMMLGPLFVVGLVGNSLFIMIIAFHTRMRTVTNKYICNLSAANLLTILAAALGPVLDNAHVLGGVGPWVCNTTQLLHEAGSCAAVFTLVALSAERFHAMRWPLQKNALTGFVLGLVWLLSFATSFVELHIAGVPFQCTKSGIMFNIKVVLGKSSLFVFLLTYVIPLIVIAIFFALMVREVFLAVRNPIEQNVTDEKSFSVEKITERLNEARRKIVWVVLVLVLTFVGCFLPFYTLSLIVTTTPDKRSHLARAVNIFFKLTDIFPCAHPMILYSLSEPCRRHIRHYLFQCCPGSLAYHHDDRPSRLYSDAAYVNRSIVVRPMSVITTTI